MENRNKITIRADLYNPHSEWFEEIKQKRSIESNADTIRFAIMKSWELIQTDDYQMVRLHHNLISEVQNIVNRSDIQSKYQIYNVEEFIKEAMKQYLEKLRIDTKKNILHFEVRQKLTDDELEIAMALEYCLDNSKSKGVRAQEVASRLNRRDVKKIEDVLDQFANRYLLDRIETLNSKLYGATL